VASGSPKASTESTFGTVMAPCNTAASWSTRPPRAMAAPRAVSKWASIAASFTGCVTATILAMRSPETTCSTAATEATEKESESAGRCQSPGRFLSSDHAAAPATAKPTLT
jgi:hypothetical protein